MPASTAAHLLSRQSHRPDRARVAFLDDLGLDRARAHELCGSARRTLAVQIAGRLTGPVLWIRPAWEPGRLNPDGMLALADPSRFLFVTPKRAEDVLWSAEEALRAGAVPLVVADLPGPPGLTAIRRLHLAAETGAERGTAPLGLVLTPGKGGAPGVESRWSFVARHGGDGREAWQLERRRARTEPEKSWLVRRGDRGLTLDAAPVTG
ncbi:hypothetical protein GQ651_00560 [Alphaproteobacteria bacterium GH1-50]|uniref:Protein ImuA n=1 Tax=Kangsaoukella pontilimi TaxID=2691042 RepID=A0A7C9IQG3_9RHOB|nr:hypothetical protein [Kangsaoukella pontilimi]MXQ06326.1 hypothetical protein [Kangsaoukella pontilimi]